jgi:NitT/TauT family transport system permease protein/sulfonate transport system permease protein
LKNKISKTLKSEKSVDFFCGIASIFLFLVFWAIVVAVTPVGRFIPPPNLVLINFFRSFVYVIGTYTLPDHISISITRVMVGYSIGAVTGLILGLIMGVSKIGRAIISPVFEILRPIPTIAWIPIAIIWFGIDEMPKYFITFLATYANVTLNTYAGVVSVDETLIGASKMLGANKFQTFLWVIYPAAVPNIFAGLQIALSTSWMGVLAAEMIRSNEGVGWIIIMGQERGSTVQILTGMLAIGIVGLLLAVIMREIERRLCAWNVR